jgi:phage-related protein
MKGETKMNYEENEEKGVKIIPRQIIINVCYYEDEETGEVDYDFEHMADEFEEELSKLDESVVVMCSVTNK